MVIGTNAAKLVRGFGDGKDLSSGLSSEGFVLFLALFAAGGIASGVLRSPVWVIAGSVIGVYLLLSIRVADQWEKAAVLRLGRYKGLRGPGLFFIIPVID